MARTAQTCALLVPFLTLEKTFESIALRPAREPAPKARDNLKIMKNQDSGFSKGRQKDGKRTARHGKKGAFQVKENGPFQGKEMEVRRREAALLYSCFW